VREIGREAPRIRIRVAMTGSPGEFDVVPSMWGGLRCSSRALRGIGEEVGRSRTKDGWWEVGSGKWKERGKKW
jgi:hypothetical protein